MKLTAKLLREMIKKELKEAYQQGLFGGETKVQSVSRSPESPPVVVEPWQKLENLVRMTNKEFMDLNLGLKMVRKLYKLHPNWNIGDDVPKITQIIPMHGGTIEVVFSDGKQEVLNPQTYYRGN